MGRKSLWAVLALLLLVGGGWYLLDRHNATRYHPTGDELLDRYAVEFLKDLQRNLEHPANLAEISQLPDRYDKQSALMLESWEAEFQDDLRYWQLRAIATPYGGEEHTFGGGGKDPLTVTKLPELIDAGFIEEGLYALVDYRMLFKMDSEKTLELIRRATDLCGDNAHFHYQQAALELKARRPDAAWAALARGNAAPCNDPPEIYPVSPARVAPELFRGSRANRAFYMTWITNYETSIDLPSYLIVKDFVEQVLDEYPTSLTPALFDQLLLMSHRCVLRADRPVIRVMLGHKLNRSLLESEAAVRLADQSGNDAERQIILDNNERALSALQRRLNETISQGDVAAIPGEENWDIEFERYLDDSRFLEAEIYPLLAPLGEPLFTKWAEEGGLDPLAPVLDQ